MDLSNAFATHPGVKAEKAEALNEDYAHAWNKDGIYYQAVADGNGRDEEPNGRRRWNKRRKFTST